MNEEPVWTNQQILFYNDDIYGSNSKIDLNISNNTKDFKNFSSPKINISITSLSDNSRRLYSLTIQNALDLLSTINSLTKDIDISYKNNHVIVKRYNKNKDFIIQFKKSRTGDRCVILRIFLNDSNFGLVIIPLLIFQTFTKLLKQFIDNYISINYQMNMFSILKQNNYILDQINIGIKILPSSVQLPINENEIKNEKTIENSNIESFDEFIGGDSMENIDLDRDIKKEIKKNINPIEIINKTTFNTRFFNDFLRGNILVLEDVLNSIYQNNNPCISFLELQGYNLPDLPNEIIKSISYIPRVIFLTTLRKFVESNIAIPSSNPILKFKIEKDKVSKKENDFALDLLTIQSILKIIRNKLESKNKDQLETKAVINLSFRNFTDVFIFSYLENMDSEIVKIAVIERFNYLKSIKFFDEYKQLLKINNCTEIINTEITSYINNIFNKVVGKTVFLEDLQNELYNKNSLKLPFKNKFTSEQIINEIIPIEVFQSVTNNSLKNKEDIQHKLNIDTSEDILDLFFNNEKKKIIIKRAEKLNIQKIVEEYIEEVPEEWRTPLLKYLSTLENEKFDFSKFPVIEFGDNILKSIYNWNPKEEESDLTNYVSFRNKVKNSLLKKSDILNLINEKDKNNENDELWNSISFE